jgi:hydroxymethylpyrimidine pyrophosphatase-like HAD family hydrolase
MRERFGQELDLHKTEFVFIGDSPNDVPMFAYFPHSVGVDNVRGFLDMISVKPAYVTHAACGAGFAELVHALLKSRS